MNKIVDLEYLLWFDHKYYMIILFLDPLDIVNYRSEEEAHVDSGRRKYIYIYGICIELL